MQQNLRLECPKCGRPLVKFNGHIGFCQQHKWVSPNGLGFEAEAEAQNRKDAAAAEKSRLEQLRLEAEKKDKERMQRHQRAVRRVILIAVALVIIAAAIVLFLVRPGVNYKNAGSKLISGDYQAAREAYSALGSYKDSAARVVLCDSMIDLQQGRVEAAAAKLDQLAGDGQGELARQLADALAPTLADWKQRGLTPQALLVLLSRAEVIDPDGTLDVARLTEEGHAALLDGTQRSTLADDADGDGSPELIALNDDYSVTAYRMTADGNARMAIDNPAAAAYGLAFGDRYRESDIDAAIACYSEAYRLLPGDDTRQALAGAYQQRATDAENAGDMDAAIADAMSALEIAGGDEAFSFFYALNLRHCKNGRDAAAAIEMWEAFGADAQAVLTRFSAQDRWQSDAAQLHIARALELAAGRDEGCISQLRAASEMGADVTQAVAEAKSHFEPGFARVRLNQMELGLPGTDDARSQQIRADMAEEVRTAIGQWKALAVAPGDALMLIRLADDEGIDLSGIDREAIYEEAAIAAAGNAAQHFLVDWDADGYRELLALDGDGRLSLYGAGETWQVLSAFDTKLPASSCVIADEGAPLILVLSSGEDELLALTWSDGKLSALFREEGICRYRAEGAQIRFSRLLEGSIARYSDYAYEAAGTQNRPVRVGVDWQQSDYPPPSSAAEAVERYFEAKAYDIPDEMAYLTGPSSAEGFFTADPLSALPAPDAPGTVQAAPYQTGDDCVRFEVTYPAGAQRVRTYITAAYSDGWRLTEAADSYGPGLSTEGIDFEIPLISLNGETQNTLSTRGGRSTYRVLVPSPGRIGLLWQSGSKASSRTSHAVSMVRDALTGEAVFSFELQPSPGRQQSRDMFVSPGVYYVTVEAKISDADPYRLKITYTPQTHVELEDNDTAAAATPVDLNTGYSGALSDPKDVDYYSFALEQDGAVNVTFGTAGEGSRSAAHTLVVLSGQDGGRLCAIGVPGNVQLAETGNLYLSQGTYLVQVSKGSAFASDEYVLTVNVDHSGIMESEHNDTQETADAVPVNEDIHASFGQEGDVDFYTFTLEGDAVIQPKLAFTPTDSASKTYVLTIMDAARRELLRANIGGKESTKVITPVALAAGTYTVKVENPRFVRQDYALRLVCMAVDCAEKEPNGTEALATDLAVGRPCTAVLTTDEDVDWYRVSFAEPATVTLRFSFAQSTSASDAFTLSIEQNGKAQWTTRIKGDSGGIEQALQFPAGEYYLRVKPSNWYGAVYTIALE